MTSSGDYLVLTSTRDYLDMGDSPHIAGGKIISCVLVMQKNEGQSPHQAHFFKIDLFFQWIFVMTSTSNLH